MRLHIASSIILSSLVGLGHALPITTNKLVVDASQALGTFCADPNQGGNCVIVGIGGAGTCIDITSTLNPSINGVSSFVPSNGGICFMFTESACEGDLWEIGTSLLNFSLLSLNGVSPDNAILTVICFDD